MLNHCPNLASLPLIVVSDAEMGFQAPPPQTLIAMFLTLTLSASAYVYWDKIIVPQKRTELSLSKRKGEVKQYLEELREDEGRGSEKWLMNDWLEPKAKDRAVPFLPKKKFNSGDNPVVFATALLLFPVLIGSAIQNVLNFQ